MKNLVKDSNSSQKETETNASAEVQEGNEERKKKLAKRLLDITNKLDEISNQVYKLQQRVEVIERKTGISGFN